MVACNQLLKVSNPLLPKKLPFLTLNILKILHLFYLVIFCLPLCHVTSRSIRKSFNFKASYFIFVVRLALNTWKLKGLRNINVFVCFMMLQNHCLNYRWRNLESTCVCYFPENDIFVVISELRLVSNESRDDSTFLGPNRFLKYYFVSFNIEFFFEVDKYLCF